MCVGGIDCTEMNEQRDECFVRRHNSRLDEVMSARRCVCTSNPCKIEAMRRFKKSCTINYIHNSASSKDLAISQWEKLFTPHFFFQISSADELNGFVVTFVE